MCILFNLDAHGFAASAGVLPDGMDYQAQKIGRIATQIIETLVNAVQPRFFRLEMTLCF